MAFATQNVDTPELSVMSQVMDRRFVPCKGAVNVFAGTIVVLDANGFGTKASVATGLIVMGIAQKQVDNSTGADGDKNLIYKPSTVRLSNLASDPIVQSDLGKVCYIADDQTVAKTSGTGTRSVAGRVLAVDSVGVFVAVGFTSVFG